MIEFESRTGRQREMVKALSNLVGSIDLAAGDDLQAALMTQAMQGDLAKYLDLILAGSDSLLPIRLDALRQLVFYGDETPGEGRGMAKSAAEFQPVKYALTAMGLAAISSGRAGREAAMAKYMPEIAKGRLFSYCITEPNAGTNTTPCCVDSS